MSTDDAIHYSPWSYIKGNDNIPTFRTAKTCKTYVREHRNVPTNPAGYPFCQTVSVVIGIEQLETYIFPCLDASRRRIQKKIIMDDIPANAVTIAAVQAFRSPLYKWLSPSCFYDAVLSTWLFMYKECRCGIFVRISGGKLDMFVPFYNPDYKNTHGFGEDDKIPFSLDGKTAVSHEVYLERKNRFLRYPEELINDKSKWWTNGPIVCNIMPKWGWGDFHFAQIRDMIQAVCSAHTIPDVEFFFNKRDNPVLRTCGSLQYHAPVFGFYTGKYFSDIAVPTAEDWEIATGKVFPPGGCDARTNKNIEKATCIKWSAKKNTAVFRGSATGAGVTPDTNVRLSVVDACHSGRVPNLDAGITSWSIRDKIFNKKVRFLDPDNMAFKLSPFVSFEEQCKHKVILYIDGHAAANRLGSMMLSGSLTVRVLPDDERILPDGHESWISRYLVPFPWKNSGVCDGLDENDSHMYNCIECTVSDLGDALEWVWKHDKIAMRLASTAKDTAKIILDPDFITKDIAGMLLHLHEKTKGGIQPCLFSQSCKRYVKTVFYGNL